MDSKSPEQQEEHVSEETLQRAFLKLDSRGHGKFGPGELRAFLAKHGTVISEKQADEIIVFGDENDDGAIDFAEFINCHMAGRVFEQRPTQQQLYEQFAAAALVDKKDPPAPPPRKRTVPPPLPPKPARKANQSSGDTFAWITLPEPEQDAQADPSKPFSDL